MPKDALTIYRAACELDMLIGGKTDKVNMPDRDTLLQSVVAARAHNGTKVPKSRYGLGYAHVFPQTAIGRGNYRHSQE